MRLIIFSVFVLLSSIECYPQGCGDAGFCSIHSVKPENEDNADTVQFPNILKTGISLGNTRYEVWIITPYMEYTRHLSQKWMMSLKISGVHRRGQLTNVTGFSDAIVTASFQIVNNLRVIAGAKIPFNDANRSYQQRPVPMAYQTSLGTYDGIFGLQYRLQNWAFATAWQQPFIQNGNRFVMNNFAEAELGHIYPETNKYKRAGDVLLRVSFYQMFKKKLRNLSIIYSLLPIYHIAEDSYTDGNGNKMYLKGSEGLTLNINTFLNYSVNPSTAFELSVGFPVIAREVRPDGLSQFALTLEFVKKF